MALHGQIQVNGQGRKDWRETCEHPDTWFDRVVCPDPCGGMHEYCADCGHPIRGCLNESSPSVPPARYSGRDRCTCGAHSFRGLARHLADCGTDSGRDEAREAVARWIHGLGLGYHWSDGDAYRLKLADQVLSLPAVAALLRDGTTT